MALSTKSFNTARDITTLTAPADRKKYDDAADVLVYLIGVANKTERSEVWRALFADLLQKINEERAAH